LLNIEPATLEFRAHLVGYPEGLLLALENRHELRADVRGVPYQV
jgi:hypothetical protein